MMSYKRIVGILATVISAMAIALGAGLTQGAAAPPVPATAAGTTANGGIRLAPGIVEPGRPIEDAVLAAVATAGDALPPAPYYAVTNVYARGGWYFVSVAGLAQVGPDLSWILTEDANWFGLVLLRQLPDGSWDSAVEGTVRYSQLLSLVPDGVMPADARRGLDPLVSRAQSSTVVRFPWPAGTSMEYGPRGLHPGDFNGWAGIQNWKAVDWVSDGNTAAGHAPNRLVAATAGTVTGVCNDGLSVAIRLGDLLYAHLLNNSNLQVGHVFSQGDQLGQLKTGSFQAGCGWASQGDGWFHVHWAFPAIDPVHVEDWTLSLSDGLWRRGSETQGIYTWFRAGDTTPPDGDYSAPAGGQVITGTVTLAGWGTDAGSGLAGAQFTAQWGGQWHPVGPEFPTSPFTFRWDTCAAGVPDGDIELGLDLRDGAANIAHSPRGTRHVTKSYDCGRPPYPPQLMSPDYWSSQAAGVEIVFTWRPPGNASEYMLEWWGGTYPVGHPCGWTSATQCRAGVLNPGATYYWRVKARNAAGESAWSPAWPFTVSQTTGTVTGHSVPTTYLPLLAAQDQVAPAP